MTITSTTMDPVTLAGPARPERWATTQHVIYRYDPVGTPPICYHSMPHTCTGGAATFNDARKSYRSDMTSLLAVERHGLPRVVEHLEGAVAGMWVRTKVGAVHRDPHGDRMLLQTLLSDGPGQKELRGHLETVTSRGASPVLVIVEHDDTLGAVLDQMRADDALLVVHSDARTVLGWVTIYGPDAGGADDALDLADDTAVRQLAIIDLTRAYAAAGFRDVRLRRHQLRYPATPKALCNDAFE